MKAICIVGIILSALFAVALTGCNRASNRTLPEDEPLRVIFGGVPELGTEEAFKTINAILDEAGFNMVFEPMPASYRNEASFSENIRIYIADNSQNVAFLMTPNFNVGDELFEEGLLGNFIDDALLHSPMFMRRSQVASRNSPDTLYFIPTNFTRLSPHVMAVLVREDIALEYGMEITTGSEYVALLEWLKERDPEITPGAAIHGNVSEMRFTPLDLFMPEHGYIKPFMLYVHINVETGQVLPTTSIEASRYAIEEFARLLREGLLDLVTGNIMSYGTDFRDYPTMLIYAYDLLDMMPMYAAVCDGGFDVYDYRMFILYGNQVPFVVAQGLANMEQVTAVAGRHADIGELLRFLEWLESPSSYMRMFFGESDVDYVLHSQHGNRVEVFESDVNWELVRAVMWHFERSELTPVRANAPHNYEQALAEISRAQAIVFTDDNLTTINEWLDDLDDVKMAELNGFMHDMRQMNNALFFASRTPNEAHASYIINTFIESQATPNREWFLYSFTLMVEEIMRSVLW